MNNAPLLPRAFDEWGFVSDQINRTSGSEAYAAHNLGLEKYEAYSKAFQEYNRTLSNFFDQSGRVLIVNPHLRDRTNTKAREVADSANTRNDVHLSISNLADALKVLPTLQEEYRDLLSQFLQCDQLSVLENQERRAFREIWCSWYSFVFYPNSQFQNAAQECVQRLNKKVREVRNAIKREIQAISSPELEVSILAENVLWDKDNALWIVVDGGDVTEVFNFAENVVAAVSRAIDQVESTELRYYAIRSWAYIAIVPRVRGRSLNTIAWRFDSILFAVESSSTQLV